jgi:hypothetical protein
MSNEKSTRVHIYVASIQKPDALAALFEAIGPELDIRSIQGGQQNEFAVALLSATGSAAFSVENVAQLRDLRRLIDEIADGGWVSYTTFGVGPVAFCALSGTEVGEIIQGLEDLRSKIAA